jgi:D-tagatose 6-phosphate 4-epimerase
MSLAPLLTLASDRRAGHIRGIASICSAHPDVVGATLAFAAANGGPVLIEATCNQVNQDGGYTGMTPAAFRTFVLQIAQDEGCDPANLILGGDHLGPNPWTHLPATDAMAKACTMVAAYVQAGFGKIHLDASMSCADDPIALPGATIATRNATLAAVAEAQGMPIPPVYVIGTEVPIPGGAMEVVDHLVVTTPQAATETADQHRAAFAAAGIAHAFDRVVGLVVQPGVEFGNANVVAYHPAAARALCACLPSLPMLFEAHSTDYQTQGALVQLVDDGFGILKVGPGLTFALREALFALDHIADVLCPGRVTSLRATMDGVMLANPIYWQKYYANDQPFQRHFSYSDRIRYYWTAPAAMTAVRDLMSLLGNMVIPEPLVSQYFGASYDGVMTGAISPTAPALLRSSVMRVLRIYATACVARKVVN